MTIYIESYSKYGAALYIGCWSCTNYLAASAAPAVRLSPTMVVLRRPSASLAVIWVITRTRVRELSRSTIVSNFY